MKVCIQRGGFTLPELIVCVAITSIVLSFTLPSYNQIILSNSADKVKNDLIALMSFARLEAAHHQTTITVCPLDSSNNCGVDWSNYISVFIDENDNRQLDGTEIILRSINVSLSNWTLTKRPAGRPHFQFNQIGTSNGTAGSLEFCHPHLAEGGRAVVVSFAGRVRSSADFDGDGVDERSPGVPISC